MIPDDSTTQITNTLMSFVVRSINQINSSQNGESRLLTKLFFLNINYRKVKIISIPAYFRIPYCKKINTHYYTTKLVAILDFIKL